MYYENIPMIEVNPLEKDRLFFLIICLFLEDAYYGSQAVGDLGQRAHALHASAARVQGVRVVLSVQGGRRCQQQLGEDFQILFPDHQCTDQGRAARRARLSLILARHARSVSDRLRELAEYHLRVHKSG